MVVYLDQNHWIALARAAHGVGDAPASAALEAVAKASLDGSAIFPLSAIHYVETAKIADRARRVRLAEVMLQLSAGKTIASFSDLLRSEIDGALVTLFPGIKPRPFELIGDGVAHAFGKDSLVVRLPERFSRLLPSHLVERANVILRSVSEKSALTGRSPFGIDLPPFRVATHNELFQQHLATLHDRLEAIPAAQRGDALYSMSFNDIRPAIEKALDFHGIPWASFEALGKNGIIGFLESLPSRRVDLHLHRQMLRNPALRSRSTDLEDWAGLGPAAAHCDVVVCEKHFADLLMRERHRPHASVAASLPELLSILQQPPGQQAQ